MLFNALRLAFGMLGLGLQGLLPPVPAPPSASNESAPLATSGHVFGLVDGGLLTDSNSQLDAALTDANALGVTYLREELSWSAVEANPGIYNWAPFDRVAKAATAHHISVLMLIDFTPPWARSVGCTVQSCSPANPAEFAAFARIAAIHYRSIGVNDWEIWNEPNNEIAWHPSPNATAYGTLLTETAAAIRAVEPRAFIVSGGLAPVGTTISGNIDPRSFLGGVCSTGALRSVNAVGVHPYSFPLLPSYLSKWSGWSVMDLTPSSERSVLQECGEGNKPLWATEYGAPTNGPGHEETGTFTDLALHPDHVSEALQAEMATESVDETAASPWLGALFWYEGRDNGTSTATNQNFFGLRRYDGSAKPAWFAYQTAIRSVTAKA